MTLPQASPGGRCQQQPRCTVVLVEGQAGMAGAFRPSRSPSLGRHSRDGPGDFRDSAVGSRMSGGSRRMHRRSDSRVWPRQSVHVPSESLAMLISYKTDHSHVLGRIFD